MLISLNPGLKCKACKNIMTMAKEVPGSVNMVIKQGRMIVKGDLTCLISCDSCMTIHIGEAFIRDGVFMGVYVYNIDKVGPDVDEIYI
jgi:hypothetical protein